MVFLLFVALGGAILVAVFALVNNTPVTVNLVFWKSQELSLALVILYSALAGAVTVWLMTLGEKLKLKWVIHKLRGEMIPPMREENR